MADNTTIPDNYTPLSPDQKSQWNGFATYLGQQNLGKSLDENPDLGHAYMQQYSARNPDFKLTPDQIPHIQYEQQQIRSGNNPLASLGNDSYYARKTSEPNGQINSLTAGSFYPTVATRDPRGKVLTDYGTDTDKFLAENPGAANPKIPVGAPGEPVSNEGGKPGTSAKIPPPTDDPNSRLAYAKAFTAKYGPLMSGRGDTPLRINEIPEGGSDTSKNISTAIGKKLGIDPALLYSSAMEEGMSGMFPDKNGMVDAGDDKKYPVQGSASFGLDTFVSRFPGLVKKGYLPADFDFKKYVPAPGEVGSKGKPATTDSALYKTPEDALTAKAAVMKSEYDDIDQYAKQKGIALSPRARDFFALMNYNAGEGNGHKMLDDYNNAGALKNDAFLDKRPITGPGLKASSWQEPYTNVIRRIKMADALKSEGLF
jgi:hypothetical protein